MIEPSDQQLDALLSALDDIARGYDSYDYGLPMHDMGEEDQPLNKMRGAVLSWLATLGVPASGEVIGYWHPRTRAFITPEQFASIKADVPRIALEWLPIPHPAGVKGPEQS